MQATDPPHSPLIAPPVGPNLGLQETLVQALQTWGLALRGGFNAHADDALPPLPGGAAPATVLLVGNAGPGMWQAFSGSKEASDGLAHPLNRWTRRVVDAVAASAGALALYPFEAVPVWPFQRWAARCEPVHPSPLGLLIHPQYGLWHAYRAAMVLGADLALPAVPPSTSPCQSCASQACMHSCPVDAFGAGGYKVAACASHLARPEGADCLQRGCLARRACPVGVPYQPSPAQNGFHMQAFLRAVGSADPALD